MNKIKIRKKCSACEYLRPIAEFKATSSRCEKCQKISDVNGHNCKCLKCEREFIPMSKYNKICEQCKDAESWSANIVEYAVEV